MVRRDLRTGVETMAVPACELRVGDLVGPECAVTEVRRHSELRLLVRLSTGHSDIVRPGRWYHVATPRPEGPPALPPELDEPEPTPARSEPQTPWYCALCDTVVTEPGHRNSVACAVGQDDIAHPYDPFHPNA